MNEKIKQLALDAGIGFTLWDDSGREMIDNYTPEEYLEKFAELIVRECITNIAHDTANWSGDEGTMAYYQGVQDAVKSMRKHFGVEE
jgi:hypothetical protein